jgi:antitoxin (DNA-binding transcriptional repressor) of toxin-antitoxin stability system
MGYIAIKDLKKSRELGERLKRDREIVITRDGQPFAIMVSISPDSVERSLSEVRRAMFSTAVMNARSRAASAPPTDSDIEREVDAARKTRTQARSSR